MKKRILSILLALSMIMSLFTVNVLAEGTTENIFSGTGNGSVVEYIDELGMYIAYGLNNEIYSSTDGINWSKRTSMSGSNQLKGFAYGSGIAIAAIRRANTIFLMDEYFTKREEVYTIDGDNNDGTVIRVHGPMVYDEMSGLFFAGGYDGTNTGVFYTDGKTEEEKVTIDNVTRSAMKWYKASYMGYSSNFYGNTVMNNLSTDGKGHIFASDDSNNNQNGRSPRVAVLIDATGNKPVCKEVQFGGSNGIHFSGTIDKYSNIIVELSSAFSANSELYKTTWAEAWEAASASETSPAVVNIMQNANKITSADTTKTHITKGRMNKYVCLDDKVVVFPANGTAPEDNTENDIRVITYNEDKTLASNYVTFINNETKRAACFTSGAEYISAAAAGSDGRIVALTGMNMASGATTVQSKFVAIDTKNTVTDSTDEAQAQTDRSEKVQFTAIANTNCASVQVKKNGNNYDYGLRKKTVTPDSFLKFDSETVYSSSNAVAEGFDEVEYLSVEEINPSYKYSDEIYDTFDFSEISTNGIYVWDNAASGTYTFDLFVRAKKEPSIFTVATFTVNVVSVYEITVNENQLTEAAGGRELPAEYLQAGDNVITAKYNGEPLAEGGNAAVAVYKNGALYAVEMTEIDETVSLSFNIPETTTSGYTYKVFFWGSDLKPV